MEECSRCDGKRFKQIMHFDDGGSDTLCFDCVSADFESAVTNLDIICAKCGCEGPFITHLKGRATKPAYCPKCFSAEFREKEQPYTWDT